MRAGRFLMAAVYLVAGILHFVFTSRYVAIMPAYLPAHRALVQISGGAEIAGGLGLLIPISLLQRAAAWGIVALLIAVFPANISMAIHHRDFPTIPQWALWARLPLQLPLIYWAWLYAGPKRSREGS